MVSCENKSENNLLWVATQYLIGCCITLFDVVVSNFIVQAREKDATQYEKQSGNEISKTLRKMLNKYLLRRTKAEVYGEKTEEHADNNVNGKEDERLSMDGTQK